MATKFARTSEFKITTKTKEGTTYLDDAFFCAPLKMTRPFKQDNGGIKVIMMSSSPGMMDGDVHDISIKALEGSKLWVTSQSYEKVHKIRYEEVKRNSHIKVDKDSYLKYLPLSTIPYADSRYNATTNIELEDDTSKLIMTEVISCGRYVNGEKFEYTYYKTLVDVTQQGELLYRDNSVFIPKDFAMEGIGMLENHTHLANILIFNFNLNEDIIAKIRAVIDESNFDGGLSITWSNDVVIRILGHSSQELIDISEKIIDIVEEFGDVRFNKPIE